MALKNEELPENITIKYTNKKMELREKNIRAVHYISQSSIDEFKSWLNTTLEPTQMKSISIQSPGEKSFDLYIPKFLAHEYNVLNPNFKMKNEKSLTCNSSDWIKKIKKIPELNDLIQYVELQSKLKTKEDSPGIDSSKIKI
jgi:hypothetical protein